MRGYYRNTEATANEIDPDGWFDSGDIGTITATNNLTITGRVKEIIVLSNGENIEYFNSLTASSTSGMWV